MHDEHMRSLRLLMGAILLSECRVREILSSAIRHVERYPSLSGESPIERAVSLASHQIQIEQRLGNPIPC
jgi:hypothetical protein